MKKFLLGLSLVTSTTLAGVAQQEVPPPAKGFFVSGVGESSDCEIARNLAIKHALEKFAGQEFSHKSRHQCSEKNHNINCSFEKTLDIDTAGTVKRVVDQKIFQTDKCVVSVTLEVERSKLFDVTVVGKNRYLSGEPLEFFIETKEPLYLYIFNSYDAGLNHKKVELVFPRKEVSQNLVNGKFVFPGTDKFRFLTYVAVGNESKEQLIFLFTKHKLYDNKEWTISELDSMIKSMPAFTRRVVYQDIVIERRLR